MYMEIESYKIGMGKRIKMCRRNLQLTQEDIAEKLNISVKHISEVERGLAGLSVENLLKLSEIYNVSIDYIVRGDSSDLKEYLSENLNPLSEEKKDLMKELISLGIKLTR